MAALQRIYPVDILIGNHQTLIVRSNDWNKKYIQLGLDTIQNNCDNILQSCEGALSLAILYITTKTDILINKNCPITLYNQVQWFPIRILWDTSTKLLRQY